MSVLSKEIPQDWYRTAFADTADMAWTDRTESEINRALNMLRPAEGARVLDIFSPPRPEYKKAGSGFGT